MRKQHAEISSAEQTRVSGPALAVRPAPGYSQMFGNITDGDFAPSLSWARMWALFR